MIGADNPDQLKGIIKIIEGETFNRETRYEIEQRIAGDPECLFMPYLWDKQKEQDILL